MKLQIIETPDYILVVSDEEIKLKDWYVHNQLSKGLRIWQDNTQFIPMDAKKIIAHLPKGNAPELDLPLLPEMVVEDDAEKLAKETYPIDILETSRGCFDDVNLADRNIWIKGYKAATKRYSEDDLRKAIEIGLNASKDNKEIFRKGLTKKEEIDLLLQSLKQSKTPTHFLLERIENNKCIGKYLFE
jgi:hypothetical protein